MADLTSAIRNTVSISLFNRGLAGKVFQEVRKSGAKVVIKNNEPECVLLSPEEYIRLMDEVNDARLLEIAVARMQQYDPAAVVSAEEVYAKCGITEEDLAGSDEVEIE